MAVPPAAAAAASVTAGKPLRRDAAHNRERLVRAAAQVFAEHGLDAGVEEVARVAGVGMGTLYRRFPTKQALIDELIGDLRLQLLQLALAAAARTDGTGLEELLSATGQLQADQPGCLQRLWNQSQAQPQALREFRQLMVGLLREAQRHGRVRPEVRPSDITVLLWSVRGVIETTRAQAPTAWRRHLELLVAGLRPPGDSRFAGVLQEKPMSDAQLGRILGGQPRP
jgi:AcrR family transcriptional regulator